MAICVVVFKENQKVINLIRELQDAETPLSDCKIILPSPSTEEIGNIQKLDQEQNYRYLQPVDIETVKLLSPKLQRSLRQKVMAFWLMPFGFFAGLAFTQMTDLKTFSNLGLGNLGELLIGGILGMGSGLIGSYVSASSVNSDKNDDVGSLRKLNKNGLWLILLETPIEFDLPWKIIKDCEPINIVKLNRI